MSEAKKQVLVVDDEASVVKMVSVRLERAGLRVSTAYDGQTALLKVQIDPPDLIILDVMLPKLNGYEVCSILKRDERSRHIPIIMFTALRDDEDYWRGMACGADAYLTKPFKGEGLSELVNRLILAVIKPSTSPDTGPGGSDAEQPRADH
ncbi:MAG: response regulator [Candidatus Omnitrophica bacterium]|nr:response regulator [Candidatus Omnitrophota bacterium]